MFMQDLLKCSLFSFFKIVFGVVDRFMVQFIVHNYALLNSQ